MEPTRQYIYIVFDIKNQAHQKVGTSKVLIHKRKELFLYRNPQLAEKTAVKFFKEENPDYNKTYLSASYTGDLLPKSSKSQQEFIQSRHKIIKNATK